MLHLGNSLNNSLHCGHLVSGYWPVAKRQGGMWGIEGVCLPGSVDCPGSSWTDSSGVGTKKRPGQVFRFIIMACNCSHSKGRTGGMGCHPGTSTMGHGRRSRGDRE